MGDGDEVAMSSGDSSDDHTPQESGLHCERVAPSGRLAATGETPCVSPAVVEELSETLRQRQEDLKEAEEAFSAMLTAKRKRTESIGRLGRDAKLLNAEIKEKKEELRKFDRPASPASSRKGGGKGNQKCKTICFFYHQNGACLKGADCPFKHVRVPGRGAGG